MILKRKFPNLKKDLESTWNETNTPVAERIDVLFSLLDEAEVTPELMSRYQDTMSKLNARLSISQVSVMY